MSPFYKLNRCCCADTVGVIVNPPDPPVDVNLLVQEDFFDGISACQFDPYWDGGVPYDMPASVSGHLPSEYTPNTSADRFGLPSGETQTPEGSTCAVHYFYRLGENDHTPAQVQKTPFPATDAVFVRWYEYFQSPFIWPPGQKLARFFTNSGLGGILQFQWNTEPSGNQSYTFFLDDFNNGTIFGGTFNYAEGPGFLALDTWHKMEIYVKQSSNGVTNDGRMALWVNDVLLQDSGPINTRIENVPMDGYWVGGNNTWNGTGPGGHTSVPQNQSRYFADIRSYDGVPPGITLP